MNRRDSLATGDVIYVRSLHEIEVKQLRVGEIIHLGPVVSKEQTRVDAKRVCSGLLVSAVRLLYEQGHLFGMFRGKRDSWSKSCAGLLIPWGTRWTRGLLADAHKGSGCC